MEISGGSKLGSPTAARFYRPELDGLRFFAFLAVLVHHSPTQSQLAKLSAVGGFGLPMFFLLSAYLITELLLREHEQTGTVAWKLFYIRRALRIWPLYYGSILAAVAVGLALSALNSKNPHFSMPPLAVLAMSLFVVNWVGILSKISLLVAHLWSISIEEQFYLIWPPVIRFGGKPFALIISIGMFLLGLAWIHIFWARGWLLWYDTAVQFLFFSAGALIAICTRSLQLDQIRTPARILLGVLGLASLSAAALISQVGSDRIMGLTSAALYLGYLGGLLGCVAIFIAVLGFKSVPAPLSYLGKISYGLYVFHRLMLMTAKVLWSGTHLPNPLARALLIDGSAFVFSVVAAHFSYKYFESPFLKLKERFTVVKSRPA